MVVGSASGCVFVSGAGASGGIPVDGDPVLVLEGGSSESDNVQETALDAPACVVGLPHLPPPWWPALPLWGDWMLVELMSYFALTCSLAKARSHNLCTFEKKDRDFSVCGCKDLVYSVATF